MDFEVRGRSLRTCHQLPSYMLDPTQICRLPQIGLSPEQALRIVVRLAAGFGLVVVLLAGTTADAQQWRLEKAEHPWGSFLSGSWKVVKVVSTEYAEDGSPSRQTVTRTETVLSEVTDEDCTLSVRTESEVRQLGEAREAQQFASEPSDVTLAFRLDPLKGGVRETIVVDGKRITVQLLELKRLQEGRTVRHRVWYRPGKIPAVLRQTIEVRTGETSDDVQLMWESKVTALGQPVQVLDDRGSGWQVRTTRKTSAGTTATVEYHSAEIPGTLVRSVTTVTDPVGKVTRRSELSLQAYGACYQKTLPRRSRRRRSRTRRRREPQPEAKRKDDPERTFG